MGSWVLIVMLLSGTGSVREVGFTSSDRCEAAKKVMEDGNIMKLGDLMSTSSTTSSGQIIEFPRDRVRVPMRLYCVER